MLKDEDFYLPGTPYTKEEIRAVLLKKLNLKGDEVVYEVGSGSGTVTVELALSLPRGKVYAFEKDLQRLTVIKENLKRFSVRNVVLIPRALPCDLSAYPPPDTVVIGGSSNLREVLEQVGACLKNGGVLAGLAVTLESLAIYQEFFQNSSFTDYDGISIAVTRLKKAGNYHILNAQNPVFIFTGRKREEKNG